MKTRVCLKYPVNDSTLQLQMTVLSCLLTFGFFVAFLGNQLSRFCFADISEIVKTFCSICETVSSLVQF